MTDDFYEPAMISKSWQNFLQIEATPKTKEDGRTCRLRFIVSFNFIGSSLDSLSESLKKSNLNFDVIKNELIRSGFQNH